MAINIVEIVINGRSHYLSLNEETGFYEAEIEAPKKTSYENNEEHYYPITVNVYGSDGDFLSASDDDPEFGEFLRLRVKETIAPTIRIFSPENKIITNDATPMITWAVTDSGSKLVENSVTLFIDNIEIATGITKTNLTNGYQYSYETNTEFLDGVHTIKITAEDNDGNIATSDAVTFVVDTTPPILEVLTPEENLITNKSIEVVGKTTDETSGIQKLTVKLNNETEISVAIDSDGSFTKEIYLEEGKNTIIITSYDNSGLKTYVARNVILNTGAPIIEYVELTPNPVSTGEIVEVNVGAID